MAEAMEAQKVAAASRNKALEGGNKILAFVLQGDIETTADAQDRLEVFHLRRRRILKRLRKVVEEEEQASV